MSYVVSAIYIYPVKSLGGVPLLEATIDDRGLRWDRRWMIVDENNKFLTQREVPKMAAIRTAVTSNGDLTLITGTTKLTVPVPEHDHVENVQVWDDVVPATRVSSVADAFLSHYLSRSCSLVFMPESTQRATDPDYSKNNEIVSFADGYPILLTNNASLHELNSRIGDDIPMSRFRPNIVIDSDASFAEDDFGLFRLGGTILEGVKHCARCPITLTDQETGERLGNEPLKTLATFRRGKKGVLFGENLMVRQPGLISVGDKIEPIALREIYPRPVASDIALTL